VGVPNFHDVDLPLGLSHLRRRHRAVYAATQREVVQCCR